MTPLIPMNINLVEILRGCTLFHSIPLFDIEKFAANATLKEFASGDLVFARGSIGKEFYIVIHGTVQITVPTISARTSRGNGTEATEAVMRVVQPGEFFGEIACLEEIGLRTANARTPDRCVLLILAQDEFLILAQAHPQVAMELARHLAARVRHHTDSLAGLVLPEDYEQAEERKRNLWQMLADGGAQWSAHWTFTVVNVVVWLIWLGFNGSQLIKDLPTINGLTMWVSLQAIIMTTFVLVAQKRADERENHRKELQFQWAQATMERLNQVAAHLEIIEKQERHSSSTQPHQ
jgi:CRP-like cAMP-binding protein